MKAVRQLEQIICKDIRTKPVQNLWNDLRELTNSFGKIEFGGISEPQSCSQQPVAGFFRYATQRRDYSRLPCFTKNRANSDVRILQIRRGVPVQRKHFVPRKNIICRPVLREIGI